MTPGSPTDDSLQDFRPHSHVLVGEISTVHGLGGEVSVKVLSENTSRFSAGNELLVGPSPERARPLLITSARAHKDRTLVRFRGIDDRSGAEALRGMLAFVTGDRLPALDHGRYWEHELAGSKVVDKLGRQLGTLAGVEGRAEQDAWRVDTDSGPVLVPAVGQIVIRVDVSQKLIVVDPPEGLFPSGARGRAR